MDFSKVRLADFVRSSLREELPVSPAAAGAVAGDSKLAATPVVAPRAACASAPEYTVTLTPLSARISESGPAGALQFAQHDGLSQYSLAVEADGVLVWRARSANSLFFPLPEGHTVSTLLLPPDLRRQSRQPAFVAVDRASGVLSAWATVSETVTATDSATGLTSNRLSDSVRANGQIPLGSGEKIELLESVHPFGIAASTSAGNQFLVNLSDDLGRQLVRVTRLRARSPLAGLASGIAGFAAAASAASAASGSCEDAVVALRAGQLLKTPQGTCRELYVLRRRGDLAVWHVANDGAAELTNTVRVGSLLHLQINLIYPNSATSLVVHDIAADAPSSSSSSSGNRCHVLASFAPHRDLEQRYLVLVSLNLDDPDQLAVYRVQSYEPESAAPLEHVSLHVSSGVLVIVSADKLTFVAATAASSNSSSSSSGSSRGAARWEESLSLKPGVRVLGASSLYAAHYAADCNEPDLGVSVATTRGFLQCTFHISDDEEKKKSKSTTQARLEQAIFDSRPQNPLDLAVWPQFSARPDANAVDELAMQIALARTPFLPREMPDLGAHLELRACALRRMYALTEDPQVRELAQTLAAAHELLLQFSAADAGVQRTVDAAAGAPLPEFLRASVLKTPELLSALAAKASGSSSSSSSSGGGPAGTSFRELAGVLLEVLLACDRSGVGMPHWATCSDKNGLKSVLQRLTQEAVAGRDFALLSATCELLCAFTSVETPDGANNSWIRQLLLDLSALGVDGAAQRATEIAAQFRVYSALAPLEVRAWLSSSSGGGGSGSGSAGGGQGIDAIVAHIAEFGDVYASAVFETCITQGHSQEMVAELAPYYPHLIDDYLCAHKLHNIAWTLAPRSVQSTVYLSAATREAVNNHDRRVFASLYKLSAHFNGRATEFAAAESDLRLCRAQEALEAQFPPPSDAAAAAAAAAAGGPDLSGTGNTTAGGSTTPGGTPGGTSVILRHGVRTLHPAGSGHAVAADEQQAAAALLDAPTAVDMLCFAPAVFEELVENMALAFALVDAHDEARLGLLVQQAVSNTDWISLREAGPADAEYALRDTLFYQLMHGAGGPHAAERLVRFRDFLAAPAVDAVKRSYPWDTRGIVVKELATVAARARDIADRFGVDRWVAQMRDS